MINETDIDAFSDDIKEVGEFVRRAKKGLPEDRWYDGVTGAKRLATGFWRLSRSKPMQWRRCIRRSTRRVRRLWSQRAIRAAIIPNYLNKAK